MKTAYFRHQPANFIFYRLREAALNCCCNFADCELSIQNIMSEMGKGEWLTEDELHYWTEFTNEEYKVAIAISAIENHC